MVMWNGSIIQAEVVDPEPDKFTKRFKARSVVKEIDYRLRYDEEGAEWCRGHDGEDVEALLAAEAMADRTQPLRPAGTTTGRWSSKR